MQIQRVGRGVLTPFDFFGYVFRKRSRRHPVVRSTKLELGRAIRYTNSLLYTFRIKGTGETGTRRAHALLNSQLVWSLSTPSHPPPPLNAILRVRACRLNIYSHVCAGDFYPAEINTISMPGMHRPRKRKQTAKPLKCTVAVWIIIVNSSFHQ